MGLVLFSSFSNEPSSSTMQETSFHFPREAGRFRWSCELWPPSDTAECCHPDLVFHPFDDRPELFFVIALFQHCQLPFHP